MKAQSSIEYLTTYGWMLIAVSVAGTTVFTYTDSGCQTRATGFQTENLDVGDFGVSVNQELTVSLTNNGFEKMEIRAVNVTSADGSRFVEQELNVSSGETAGLAIPGYQLGDICRDYDLKIIFDRGPLEGQQVVGTLTGPFQSVNISNPPAPENLDITD